MVSLIFLKKKLLADNTFAFWFDSSSKDFDFHPGQYVSLFLDTVHGEEFRDFTIASSPMEKDMLIVTKLRESEFKKKLLSLSAGDEVRVQQPAGGFYLRDSEQGHLVFIAGGIGITPFRSMLYYAVARNLPVSITFIASFSTMESVIFYDELHEIAKHKPQIKIVYTLTKHDKTKNWPHEEGRIDEGLIRKYVRDVSAATYFIAGAPEMVTDTEELLYRLGVKGEQVRMEQFSGY